MIAWIAFAKTMNARTRVRVPFTTEPAYGMLAEEYAVRLARFSAEELAVALQVNPGLAEQTAARYRMMVHGEAEQMPALAAYAGAVFRRIGAEDFDAADWRFAQEHLRIVSALYGLLRPLDRISAYRLEGGMSLDGRQTVAQAWRNVLTSDFIRTVQEGGGVLVDLASIEMRSFLDWPAVETAVRVVRPEFLERRDGRLKSVTMFAKMCRGEMVRQMVRSRWERPEELTAFAWEGFRYEEAAGTADGPVFVRNLS